MRTLYAEIEINAPKRLVWQILTAKEWWKYWNTFLFDFDPSVALQQGQQVQLLMRRIPEEEDTEIRPLVTLMQPEVCLKWVYSSIPGFKSEFVFELQDIGLRRTKYVHKDNFSGMLTRAFVPFIREDERRGMRRMARELKRYVERY